MKALILLRPEPGLSRSVARAEALGLQTIACPLFVIERLTWTPPEASEFDALLLTSANAVREAGPGLAAYRALPVHAVGARTAEAAVEAGYEVATVGAAGVTDLLEALPPQRLLQLAGAHRVAPAPGSHRLTIVPVYRAATLAEAVLPPLDGGVIAVHSPRAGRRLAELAEHRHQAQIVAISAAAAAACGGGWRAVEVAPVPTDDALLALAARLCQVGDHR